MARNENSSGSVPITITVAESTARLLERLAQMGPYGRNRANVAALIVDRRIQEYIESGFLKLDNQPAQADHSDANHA
jgi:hypothetical protein